MSEEQARALGADIERTPGWLAERVESVNHLWFVIAVRDADPSPILCCAPGATGSWCASC
jgi:hypothetical protein